MYCFALSIANELEPLPISIVLVYLSGVVNTCLYEPVPVILLVPSHDTTVFDVGAKNAKLVIFAANIPLVTLSPPT